MAVGFVSFSFDNLGRAYGIMARSNFFLFCFNKNFSLNPFDTFVILNHFRYRFFCIIVTLLV